MLNSLKLFLQILVMPKLYSSVFILYILEKNGFFFVSQKGSHIKFRKDGEPTLTVIIPANRKQIPMGTFNSIVR
jgi:predicted RNA binding protein YcfA (HicA-like mRNA interferase family)